MIAPEQARDTGGLREAAEDVVIQEGRYYERDGSGESKAWIGIEREAEYVAIAEARLNGTQKGLAL